MTDKPPVFTYEEVPYLSQYEQEERMLKASIYSLSTARDFNPRDSRDPSLLQQTISRRDTNTTNRLRHNLAVARVEKKTPPAQEQLARKEKHKKTVLASLPHSFLSSLIGE